MKIPSWTGNEVEAMVGMQVIPKHFAVVAPLTIVEIWEGGRILLSDDYSYSSECCTMIHCPFQVGDECEFQGQESGKWYPVVWDHNAVQHCRFMNANPELYRHASPDLRTSPDYTEEK
jgi:hypothetical protein